MIVTIFPALCGHQWYWGKLISCPLKHRGSWPQSVASRSPHLLYIGEGVTVVFFPFVRVFFEMVFYPPSWVPKLPLDPPDTVSISDFMLSNDYGRRPLEQSRNIFTCGLTGKSYTPTQTQERVRDLARGLRKEFGWSPNTGTEWDKVAAVFSLNAVSEKNIMGCTARISCD